MSTEIDYDLTLDQWEALKALRLPAPENSTLHRLVVDSIIALRLAAMADGRPTITAKGRSVLLRGSPRLWDLAA
jgi:hypothetical protein